MKWRVKASKSRECREKTNGSLCVVDVNGGRKRVSSRKECGMSLRRVISSGEYIEENEKK